MLSEKPAREWFDRLPPECRSICDKAFEGWWIGTGSDDSAVYISAREGFRAAFSLFWQAGGRPTAENILLAVKQLDKVE